MLTLITSTVFKLKVVMLGLLGYIRTMQRREYSKIIKRDSVYDRVVLPQNNQKSTEVLATEILRIQKLQRSRNIKRFFFALMSVLVLAGLLLIWLNYSQQQKQNSAFAESVRKSALFTLYVPDEVNYKTIKETVNYDNGILIYQTSSVSSNESYTITEQLRPDGFDISQYKISQGMTDTNELIFPSGKAISGRVLNQKVLILATNKTLISIVANSPPTASGHEELASTLVPIKH